jgi:hypothetical protein
VTAQCAQTDAIKSGARAVVIGGSLAGLLAARVLSVHFDRITFVERRAGQDHPPADEQGFLEFARNLRASAPYDLISQTEALSDIVCTDSRPAGTAVMRSWCASPTDI